MCTRWIVYYGGGVNCIVERIITPEMYELYSSDEDIYTLDDGEPM